MNPNIQDITPENAQALLIEESFQRPVLVDFWADWCGPCKSLMPVLEKLAAEFQGQFLLAKVNADEQQMIASQFGVRSLPTVYLIKDGQPVDGFSGAQPEQQIRELLQKYLPSPAELALKEVEPLLAAENYAEAYPALKQAYEDSSQAAAIALPLAQCLIHLKRYDEAEGVLKGVKMVDQDALYEQCVAQLDLARTAEKSPEITALEAELKQAPDDKAIQLKLAVQYSQHEYHADALAMLYSIISRDLNFADGEAKKTYLDILASLGKSDPAAVEYQRKLYTLLY
ncbi:Thioredoxin [Thalassocella blandensis]|nr:Thioredoxin [Thalassocella blandensis]